MNLVCLEVSNFCDKTAVLFESVFPLNLSYLYEVVDGDEEGYVVLSSRFLFFSSLRARPIL